MVMGAVGGVCALANVAPQPLIDLIAAFNAEDMEKATALQLRMVAPNNVCPNTRGGLIRFNCVC